MRVLITQGEFANFAGTEIFTLELSEWLQKNGHDVTIYTNYLNSPIKEEIPNKVRVITPEIEMKNINFDLIWVHHQLIPIKIIEKITKTKYNPNIFFFHMSSFHPLEFPRYPDIELLLADHILYNSEITKLALAPYLKNQGTVINNPAPDSYLERINHGDQKERPKKIAIISNHVPNELLNAKKLLEQEKIEVTIIGRREGKPVRVTPSLLQRFDAIITIGKTVQYCILSSIPVYVYDHFGGSGYLSQKNFQKNLHFIFSGKGYSRKTPEEITNEIINEWKKASEDIQAVHGDHAKQFLLSANIPQLLLCTPKAKKIQEKKLTPFLKNSEWLWYLHYQKCKTDELQTKLEHAIDKRNELKEKNDVLISELINLRNSKYYKLRKPYDAVRSIGKRKKK